MLYETGLTNDAISTRMDEIGISRSVTIYADSAEPKSIQELRNLGWNVQPCQKGPDSVRFGIDWLKQYPIAITKASGPWWKERRAYTWAKDRISGKYGQEPGKTFNHCWDALRYSFTEQMVNQPMKVRFFELT